MFVLNVVFHPLIEFCHLILNISLHVLPIGSGGCIGVECSSADAEVLGLILVLKRFIVCDTLHGRRTFLFVYLSLCLSFLFLFSLPAKHMTPAFRLLHEILD